MKQHEYTIRADKDVFETRKPHYIIEVSTNNYECYRAIKEGINDIVSEYEEAEEKAENEEETSDADKD